MSFISTLTRYLEYLHALNTLVYAFTTSLLAWHSKGVVTFYLHYKGLLTDTEFIQNRIFNTSIQNTLQRNMYVNTQLCDLGDSNFFFF